MSYGKLKRIERLLQAYISNSEREVKEGAAAFLERQRSDIFSLTSELTSKELYRVIFHAYGTRGIREKFSESIDFEALLEEEQFNLLSAGYCGSEERYEKMVRAEKPSYELLGLWESWRRYLDDAPFQASYARKMWACGKELFKRRSQECDRKMKYFRSKV